MTTTEIAREIYGAATPAARVAVRRAMERLVAEKKIEERPRLSGRGDKRWMWKREKQEKEGEREKKNRKPSRRISSPAMDELPGIDGSRIRKPRKKPAMKLPPWAADEQDYEQYLSEKGERDQERFLRKTGDLPPEPLDDDLPF